jgi:hypothetical protein
MVLGKLIIYMQKKKKRKQNKTTLILEASLLPCTKKYTLDVS